MYILNQKIKKPLHIQLYEQTKEDIIKNYKIGDKLPSIRKTASLYNLSKNTVENAYSQLVVEGYIDSYPKSGYKVEDIKANPFKENKLNIQNQKDEEEEYLYDFSPSSLSKDTFPLKLWKRLFNKYIDESLHFGKYNYGQGEYELRVQIAKYLNKSRAVNCEASQIVISSSFIESMNMLTKIIPKKHNAIAMENPGYYIASKSFKSVDFDLIKIDLDENGIKVDDLKKIQADILYLTPSHQYPTGVTIPVSNRHKILQWAQDNDAFIIEDDYDSELTYENRPIPSLQGLDTFDRVIYSGTFSKSLSAALRISFLVLPRCLIKNYKNYYGSYFPTVPLMMQKTLQMFMSEGHWERHLRKIRTLNKKKHNIMLQALKQQLKQSIVISAKGAGLSILIKSTVQIDLNKLEKICNENKIKIYFSKRVSGGDFEALRMGFGGFKEEEIEKAIKAFAILYKECIV